MMNVDILNLLNELKARGVMIVLDNGKLQIKKPTQVKLESGLIESVKQNKTAIIDFLSSSERTSAIENIEVIDRSLEHIPLSYSQERIWFIDKFEGSISYHIPTLRKITGKLNVEALKGAFNRVVSRHEILRTVYRDHEGVPFQRVLDETNWPIDILDFSKASYGEIMEFINRETNRPFKLDQEPSIRAILVQAADDCYYFSMVIHHIAADGWSIPIFYNDLIQLYDAHLVGKEADLPTLNLQYMDYAFWQRKKWDRNTIDDKLVYWENKLVGYEPLKLNTDYPRKAIKSTSGSVFYYLMPKGLSDQINLQCANQGYTLYMFLLAAYKVLLYKYTGQRDLIIGSPIANRQHRDIESLIGFFVNTVPMRSVINPDQPFSEFLQEIKETALGAFQNQDVPIEKIIEKVESTRDISQSTLIQSLFVLQNTPEGNVKEVSDIKLEWETTDTISSKFELTFTAVQQTKGLGVYAIYCDELFKEETMVQMVHHLESILKIVSEQPSITISDISLLAPQEKEEVMAFQSKDYPFQNIAKLIQLRSADFAEKTAVHFNETSIDYKTLEQKANQLAHLLSAKGVRKGDHVPVLMSRSIEHVISCLAILKCGAVFAPLGINWPESRVAEILASLNAPIVLTNQPSVANKESPSVVELVRFQEIQGDDTPVLIPVAAEDPMYIFHTSGTTGKPKAVVVPHAGVYNRLAWMTDYYSEAVAQSVLCNTLPIFDSSVWQIFWPLMNGGQTVLPSEEEIYTPQYFMNLVDKYQITMTDFVPSLFSTLVPVLVEEGQLQQLNSLKQIVIGGEEIPVQAVNQFKSIYPEVGITNLYGPTEASIGCIFHEIETTDNKIIPIGKPIPNVKTMIVDENNRMSPKGVPGELLLGGVALAKGYLQAGKTKERFIANPESGDSNDRFYRTGDLVKWSDEGHLLYLGRIDNQLKLRGYRIEPGEIESHIMDSGQVAQCKVLKQENLEQLVAYVVPKASYVESVMVAELKASLPEYLVPTYWVTLDDMPVDSSGKVLRKQLPLLTHESNKFQGTIEGAQTVIEKQMVKIWAELLERPESEIDIKSNFFALGGHSLLVIRLAYKIEKEFSVEMSLKELFSYATIQELSGLIELEKGYKEPTAAHQSFDL